MPFSSGIAFSFSSERFTLGPVPVGVGIWSSRGSMMGGGRPRSGFGRRGNGRRGWRGGGGVLTAVNRSFDSGCGEDRQRTVDLAAFRSVGSCIALARNGCQPRVVTSFGTGV